MPETPELVPNEIEWITPAGNIGTVMEDLEFAFQLEATLTPTSPDVGSQVIFEVTGGIFPMDLELSPQGLISGLVIDMDNYVPEFKKPDGFVIAIDGSNYGTYGSAAAGTHECEFTVRAFFDEDATEERTFGILVINNYSSDRNRLIREYSEVYGD